MNSHALHIFCNLYWFRFTESYRGTFHNFATNEKFWHILWHFILPPVNVHTYILLPFVFYFIIFYSLMFDCADDIIYVCAVYFIKSAIVVRISIRCSTSLEYNYDTNLIYLKYQLTIGPFIGLLDFWIRQKRLFLHVCMGLHA